MKRIALATSAKLPTLNDDDRLLIPALAELGLAAVPAVWDSPEMCWEEFQSVVVRSCWDYHHRREEFLSWVAPPAHARGSVWDTPAGPPPDKHKGHPRAPAAPRAPPLAPPRARARPPRRA